MKRLLNSILLSGLALFLFTACQPEGKTGKDDGLKYIPAEASMVTSMNMANLMEKADFEAVKQMEFYQAGIEEMAEEEPAMVAIMKDPAASGVDLDKNVYMTYLVNPDNPEELFTAGIMSMADKGKFEALLESTLEDKDIVSAGSYKYISHSRSSIVAWNDEIAVIGGTNGYMDLQEQVKQVFETTKETSIASNKEFQKALAEDHDITSFLSSNGLAASPTVLFAFGMADFEADDLKDNFIHSYVDFEDGEIVGKSQYWLNKKLEKEFGKLFKDKVDTDFSKYVPAEDLAFVMTNALSLRGLDEFLSTRPNSKGLAETGLKRYDLTYKDIMETFGGDILLAGYGKGKKVNPDGLFATNLLSTDKLDKFIQLAIESDVIEQVEENYYRLKVPGFSMSSTYTSVGNNESYLMITDDMIFISGNESMLEQIKNGGYSKGERLNKDLLNKLENNIFATYLGFEALKKLDDDYEAADFEDLEITTDRKKAILNMELQKKGQNALKSIFEMINEGYLKDKEDDVM